MLETMIDFDPRVELAHPMAYETSSTQFISYGVQSQETLDSINNIRYTC